MAIGIMKWFSLSKRYGFLADADGGPDMFVHQARLVDQTARPLQGGDMVVYDTGTGIDGRSVATNVRLVEPESTPQ